tara:strand:+ start:61 stop:663 length:603 start_codon:yes stop_codon:yes gene_type:complete
LRVSRAKRRHTKNWKRNLNNSKPQLRNKMKKLTTFVATAILILLSSTAYADETTNSLGFAAGGTYGLGLSYSHDTPVWGIQFTALPIWDNEEGGQVFGGVNLKRNFHENGKVGIYGSLGLAAGFWRENREDCRWNQNGDAEDCVTHVDEGWAAALGPGVGMQVIFWKNMLFRFELPMAFRYTDEGYGISPIPNTALMYRW